MRMRRFIGLVFLLGVGAALALGFPDIKRYLKMRAM
jgi:hypothetical protein